MNRKIKLFKRLEIVVSKLWNKLMGLKKKQ